MKIKATIERVPGGMMIIPLFLGAALNTFAPGTAEFFGGFTGALITGTLPILGVFIFCVGATIDFRSSGYIARKGITLLLGKIGFAALLGVIAAQFIPDEGIQSGFFAGLSVLAIVAVMNETNGGLYLALMNHMGRKEDAGAFAFISTESGPFMTMVTFGVTGLAAFPWETLAATVIPFLLGCILGNLDHDLRDLFSKVVPAIIPFFAFSLGNTLNFGMLIQSGLLGILIGVSVVILSGGSLFLLDRFIARGDGVAGVAASSTAGAAVAVPYALAEANSTFAPVAESATAIIATSVIVTSLLTPLATVWVDKKINAKKRKTSPPKNQMTIN
ncbi:2-keto-3-deoxygluconate transporter [Bacillus mojavensis]